MRKTKQDNESYFPVWKSSLVKEEKPIFALGDRMKTRFQAIIVEGCLREDSFEVTEAWVPTPVAWNPSSFHTGP